MTGLNCDVCGGPTHRRGLAAASRFPLCGYCGGLLDNERVSRQRRELWHKIETRRPMDIYAVRMWADSAKICEWQRRRKKVA
jgi:hypothetical protein